jgi:hypothetical protein
MCRGVEGCFLERGHFRGILSHLEREITLMSEFHGGPHEVAGPLGDHLPFENRVERAAVENTAVSLAAATLFLAARTARWPTAPAAADHAVAAHPLHRGAERACLLVCFAQLSGEPFRPGCIARRHAEIADLVVRFLHRFREARGAINHRRRKHAARRVLNAFLGRLDLAQRGSDRRELAAHSFIFKDQAGDYGIGVGHRSRPFIMVAAWTRASQRRKARSVSKQSVIVIGSRPWGMGGGNAPARSRPAPNSAISRTVLRSAVTAAANSLSAVSAAAMTAPIGSSSMMIT